MKLWAHVPVKWVSSLPRPLCSSQGGMQPGEGTPRHNRGVRAIASVSRAVVSLTFH